MKPESLITQHAKDALKDFLKHGEFGRTEIGEKDEVNSSHKLSNHISITMHPYISIYQSGKDKK